MDAYKYYPVRPAPETVVWRSLGMGLVSALAGLFGGAWAAATAFMTSGYEIFLFAAPVGSFATGFVIWLLLVARRSTPSKKAAITAGVLTGIVSHWSCWYVTICYQNLRYVFLGESSSLGEPPIDPLNGLWGAAVFSFWSLIALGWLSAPFGGLLGYLVHFRQFRESRKRR